MISIAMTTYNSEKYLLKQLESLTNQTLKPDEVIIVDDASTDTTLLILQLFIEKNFLSNWNVYTHDKNEGYIITFKDAINKVSHLSDIIFLCDHDDEWYADKIKIMKNCMDINTRIQVLGSSFDKIDKEGKFIKTFSLPLSSNNNLIRQYIKKNACVKIGLKSVLTYNISPGCTYAFRGNFRGELLNTEVELPHDWSLSILASVNDGLYFLNTKTIRYRIHEDNTIGLKRNYQLSARKKACQIGIMEKKEMKKLILNKNFPNKDRIHQYIDSLIEILVLRQDVLNGKNNKIIILFFKSLFKRGIVQSSMVDIITALKSKKIINSR